MATTRSNLMKSDLENIVYDNINCKIILKDDLPEAELLKIESMKLINKVKKTSIPVSSDITQVDTSNFVDTHYSIMKHQHLYVISKTDTEMLLLTPEGIMFNVVDTRTIDVIMNSKKPHKITFNNLSSDNRIIDISAITKILYDRIFSSEEELVSFFLKENLIFNRLEDCLIQMFPIYSRLSLLITHQNYWKYFYQEFNKIFAFTSNLNSIYNNVSYKLNTDIKNNEFKKLTERLGLNPSSDLELLKSIIINYKERSATPYLKNTNEELNKYVDLYNNINIYSNYSKKKSSISNFYNKGLIENNYILTQNWFDDTILKVSINDLYFNTLVEVLNTSELIPYADGQGFIKNILLASNLDYDNEISLDDIDIKLLETVIKAYVSVNNEDEKVIFNYIKDNFKIILNIEDISFYMNIFNKLSVLKREIDEYNKKNTPRSTTKIIINESITTLELALNDRLRRIEVDLIETLYDYKSSFNDLNKEKIDIIHKDIEGFSLLVSDSAVMAVFERLTVLIPNIYNNHLPKTKCYSIINKLK